MDKNKLLEIVSSYTSATNENEYLLKGFIVPTEYFPHANS
jgi:hypothetical protein